MASTSRGQSCSSYDGAFQGGGWTAPAGLRMIYGVAPKSVVTVRCCPVRFLASESPARTPAGWSARGAWRSWRPSDAEARRLNPQAFKLWDAWGDNGRQAPTRSTTICTVIRDGKLAMAADSQVSWGSTPVFDARFDEDSAYPGASSAVSPVRSGLVRLAVTKPDQASTIEAGSCRRPVRPGLAHADDPLGFSRHRLRRCAQFGTGGLCRVIMADSPRK